MIRTLLVLGCLALVLFAVLGMRRGWTNRGRRQASLPPLPTVPADLGEPLLAPLTGVFVGTAFASSWQDRVVHGGLGTRADAVASWHPAGLLVQRHGATPVFVPAEAIVGARLAPGLAGAVVGAGGLLVVRWRLGETDLDTGLRADDKTCYPAWVRVLSSAREPERDSAQGEAHSARETRGGA